MYDDQHEFVIEDETKVIESFEPKVHIKRVTENLNSRDPDGILSNHFLYMRRKDYIERFQKQIT